MSKVGVDKLTLAKLTSDDSTGAVYETPVAIPGAIQIDVKPNADTAILYADNGAYESDTSEGETEITINTADLSLETQALIFGRTITAGVMSEKSTDRAPYIGIAFRVLMASGKYGYVKYMKGKAQAPSEAYKTKGDKVEFGTPTITLKCINRTYDSLKSIKTREDTTGYVDVSTTWFTVFEPAKA